MTRWGLINKVPSENWISQSHQLDSRPHVCGGRSYIGVWQARFLLIITAPRTCTAQSSSRDTPLLYPQWFFSLARYYPWLSFRDCLDIQYHLHSSCDKNLGTPKRDNDGLQRFLHSSLFDSKSATSQPCKSPSSK